jgi:hypothetical protein
MTQMITIPPKKNGWCEKYEFVSWDDDIPNMMGKIKIMFQTTNQKRMVQTITSCVDPCSMEHQRSPAPLTHGTQNVHSKGVSFKTS